MLTTNEVTEVFHPATKLEREYRECFYGTDCKPENLRATIITMEDGTWATFVFRPFRELEPSMGLSCKCLGFLPSITEATNAAYENMSNDGVTYA